MSASLIERLKQKTAQQQESAFARFRRLAFQVADEEHVNDDEAAAILAAAGATLDDLQAAVGRVQSRRQLRTQLEEIDAAKIAQTVNEEQIQEADAELTAAKEKFDATVRPLLERRQRLYEQIQQHGALKARLRETAGPAAKSAYAAAAAATNEVRQDLERRTARLCKFQQSLQERERQIDERRKSFHVRSVEADNLFAEQDAELLGRRTEVENLQREVDALTTKLKECSRAEALAQDALLETDAAAF